MGWVKKVSAGAVGPLIGIGWEVVQRIQARSALSPAEWILLAVVLLGSGYGLYELARFLRGLHIRIARCQSDIDMLGRAKVAHDGRISRLENPPRQT